MTISTLAGSASKGARSAPDSAAKCSAEASRRERCGDSMPATGDCAGGGVWRR